MSNDSNNESIGFKVLIEFVCPNMIDKETLMEKFGGDLVAAYRWISDDFTDSPYNYSTREDVIKVEKLKQ